MRRIGVVVVVALALACGRDEGKRGVGETSLSGDTSVIGQSGPEGAGASDQVVGTGTSPVESSLPAPVSTNEPPPPCTSLTVRVRAVNPGDLTVFDLQITSFGVKSGASDVPVSNAAQGAYPLLATQSYPLGQIAMPTGKVEATLVASASFARPGASGNLAGCTAPITFSIDPAVVNRSSCHVVLHFDVGGSIQTDPWGAAAFLPRFRIHY